jgi:hypothetical protein
MGTSKRSFTGRNIRSFGPIALYVAWLAFAAPIAPTASATSKAEADRLVADAASAEVSGDAARSQTLLQDAIKADPDDQLAHWQLGQVQIGDKWVAAGEAQRQAAADPLQLEYRQRRAATRAGLQEQLVLARWCRDNKLTDESQLHWAVVLSLDPTNKEALKAVDMMWKNGRLVSRNETPQQKQRAQEAKNMAKHWDPIIAKWRHAVAGHDVHAHDAALEEIRAIKELDAIPSMENVTLGKDANEMKHAEECLQIGMAFIDALANLRNQPATDSLVRHAVLSPGNKARALATEKLKSRDQHDYVPMLLGGLAMPIESSFNVATDVNGNVHYAHALYREGADSDWSFNTNKTTSQQDMGGRVRLFDTYTGNSEVGPLTESPIVTAAKKAKVASFAESRYGDHASLTESKVAQANEAAEEFNGRIAPVLAATTGKDFGDNPKAWWDWWRGENEYYANDHPVDQHYDSERNNYYYGFSSTYTYSTAPPPPPFRFGPHSCFVQGTLVWTKTGKKPIEQVELGELVLSQDVESGELKYQPVLGTTVRPPSPLLKLTLDKEQLVATLGHPFWVPGVGWRMTKELGEDAAIHCISGSSRIRSVQAEPEAKAYNLIVASFSTYFVGNSGVLVHDNTQHHSAPVVVPGVPLQ